METQSAYLAKAIRHQIDAMQDKHGEPIRSDILHPEQDSGVTEEEMRKRLQALKIEHRDLDAAIDALTAAATGPFGNPFAGDQMQIARLKKRKLLLKDQIQIIGDYLIPDIIA